MQTSIKCGQKKKKKNQSIVAKNCKFLQSSIENCKFPQSVAVIYREICPSVVCKNKFHNSLAANDRTFRNSVAGKTCKFLKSVVAKNQIL